MQSAPLPANEEQRLARLRAYDILDSATEEDYDDIVRLVTGICGTDISTISFVDRDRQWFKAAVGIEGRETARDVAFCAHTILGDELFVVNDAAADPRFLDNPLVTEEPGIRFYAGMPLQTPDGFRLGALCAIDRRPRELTAVQREALRILSRHVVDLLELRRARRELQQQNRRLSELSELKSRLMSIMAHDLQTPITSITTLISLLREHSLSDEEEKELMSDLHLLLQSTQFLIDNVIGWAARQLETTQFDITEVDPAELAAEIADSMRHDLQRKGNALELDLRCDGPIWGDRNILVFVVRNLLVNANKFTRDGAITLRIEQSGAQMRISLRDTGVGMSRQQVEGLFDWSRRKRTFGTDGEKGAGLALLFCHDFMRRIGGDLEVASEPGAGTTVTAIAPIDMRGRA